MGDESRSTQRCAEDAAGGFAAGFRDVREATLIIRMEFENFEDYWRPYMGGQGPYAEYVSKLAPEE